MKKDGMALKKQIEQIITEYSHRPIQATKRVMELLINELDFGIYGGREAVGLNEDWVKGWNEVVTKIYSKLIEKEE